MCCDASAGAGHPTAHGSLHFDLLWLSTMVYICCKEASWWRETAPLICGYKVRSGEKNNWAREIDGTVESTCYSYREIVCFPTLCSDSQPSVTQVP